MPTSNARHPIPEDGLAEVLRGWSGKADLYAALAAVKDDWAEVLWTREDVRRRASRVLYEEMLPALETWPTDQATWLDALPASSARDRRTSTVIGPGVDWVATRNIGSWPPSQYVHFERDRVPDQLLTTVMRWTLDRLKEIRKEALQAEKKLENEATVQVDTALGIRDIPPVATAVGQQPSEQIVRAIGEFGPPWTDLTPVCRILISAETQDLMEFARRHLIPVDELRWRLFHLGVLGVVLKALRQHGWHLASRKPLSAALADGPHYEATDPSGAKWDLWSESDAMWPFYGVKSPYQQLSMAVFGRDHPLGADIALVRQNVAAYLIECKYGGSRYVSRGGFHQISTYVAEVHQHLAPQVTGLLVGPDGVVPSLEQIDMAGGRVGAAAPMHLTDFLAGIAEAAQA